MTAFPSLLENIAAMRDGVERPASLAVIECTLRAGQMAPLHMHDEDEAFYVLEGSLTVEAGGEVTRLEAGAAMLAPKGIPHTYRAESERVRFMTMTFARSVGRYEDFLRAVAGPVDGASAQDAHVWPSPDEAAAVAALAGANGISVLGPPGAAYAASE